MENLSHRLYDFIWFWCSTSQVLMLLLLLLFFFKVTLLVGLELMI
jgi:hypothetical protein